MTDNAILVTGAAGFIGFHVAQRLLSAGRKVVGLDNVNDYYDPKLTIKEMLPMQLGDVPATYADIEDLVRDVGFRPATTIEQGIGRFAEWFGEYHKV